MRTLRINRALETWVTQPPDLTVVARAPSVAVRHASEAETRSLLGLDRRRPHVGGLAKAAPPYAAWDKDGVRRVRIALQCQDEYYPDWKKSLEGRFGFSETSARGKTRTYERRDVVDGQETIFTVTLTEKDRDMFAPMAEPDTDVVIWCGHSDWWARVSRDLKTAPKAAGEKVFINFMCFGRHFLHDIVSTYPSAHVITSKDPTEDSEDQAAFAFLLDGFAAGHDWKTIARAVAQDEQNNPDDNFVFPSDLRRMVYVLDSDGDGRADVLDRVFDPAPKAEIERPVVAADFAAGAPERANGRKVLEAGLLLNSLSYDHQLLDQTNREQRVRADGFFRGAPGDDRVVRLQKDGRVLRLAVSDRYAHAHPAALVGMAVFEGVRALLEPLDLSDRDRDLYALAAVAHATDNDRYPYGPQVYRGVIARYGLPKLSRRKVLELCGADHAWESGSKKTLAGLKRLLG